MLYTFKESSKTNTNFPEELLAMLQIKTRENCHTLSGNPLLGWPVFTVTFL